MLLGKHEPAEVHAMAAASILMSQAASLTDIWLDGTLLQWAEDRLSLAALTQVTMSLWT